MGIPLFPWSRGPSVIPVLKSYNAYILTHILTCVCAKMYTYIYTYTHTLTNPVNAELQKITEWLNVDKLSLGHKSPLALFV